MNLHNLIMNLPCKPNSDNFLDAGTLLTYKYGHRDARHAAAELAIAADARIEELESILAQVREDINWMMNSQQLLNPHVFEYLFKGE